MITPAQVEEAVCWLADNAETSAKARATRIYLEHFLKSIISMEMQKHLDLPVSAQERKARCSHTYLTNLAVFQKAVEDDEFNRFMRESKSALIEAWRTMESTRRTEGRAFQ